MFFSLGVSFVLRMNFPLLLTQMVYIPNLDTNNNESDLAGELVCPIRSSRPRNETSILVRNISGYKMQSKLLFLNHFQIVDNNNDRYQWSQELQGMWPFCSLACIHFAFVSRFNFIIIFLGQYFLPIGKFNSKTYKIQNPNNIQNSFFLYSS